MEDVYILGNKITSLTTNKLNDEIGRIITSCGKELVLNTNVHGINLANKCSWLKEFRNSSYIVFCDGQGVIMGARWLNKKIPERIPLTDWLWDLCSYCEENKFSMFFLGTKTEIVEVASEKFKEKFPNLMIKGYHHGFFNKEGRENEEVVDMINKANPDVLIVAFGMPIQEKWLKDNYSKLNAKVFLAGGACFDYASGKLKRGPKVLVDNGFEWLCRLIIEPRRLWKRYLCGNFVFCANVFKEVLRKAVKKDY